MELLPTDLSLTFLETWKLGETRRCTYVEYTCYLLIHSKVLDPQNRPGNRSISIGYEAIKVVAGWNMLELHPNRNTVEMACHPDFSRLIELLSEPRIYENEQFTCHDSYKGTSKSWRKFKVVLNLRSFRDWQSLKKESLEPHILYMQSLGVKVTTKKPKTWMTNGWIGRMLPTIATFGVRVALWS